MSKKCILIGLDGANPAFVLRLVQEGRLPNFQRFLEEGVFAPHCLSSLPTSTPENWTTISTGAWNGTHQVMSFQTFQPPELHGNWMVGYSSQESQAEFIWDALERAGKQSILLKYPASHPPTMSTGVQVCGCHVRPCAHQIDGAHMFSTVEPRSDALTLEPATDALEGLESGQPVLCGKIVFEARGLGAPSVDGGPPEGMGFGTPVCKLSSPGKTFYLYLLSTQGDGYDRVVLARDPGAQDRIADLTTGAWSPWIEERFETVDGPRIGTLRFKLEQLSADAAVVKLYATHVMDVDGYTYPPSVGRELLETVGPFITDIGWEGLGHDRARSWFHESVMVDLADYQNQWFVDAIAYLSQTVDWSLCMLQSHSIDCANHHALGFADPVACSDPTLNERYLAFIDQLYVGLDRMLGRMMDQADDDTAIWVVSDHGGLADPHGVNPRQALREAGLLVEDAQGAIDWSRTRAYVQNHLFVNVNLRGREPRGIVAEEDHDRTCDEIVAALHAYVDPRLGIHPYNLALRKVDMRYVGLYGDPTAKKVGDVVFTVREPFGGNHGTQLSTAAWGLGTNTSLCMLWGAGIRRGVTLDRTVWLTDITPTICHLLEVPVPRDTQGAVLYQALIDSRA
jgi:predicted AlkP superfamily phosphohydrolase/phosphomutase